MLKQTISWNRDARIAELTNKKRKRSRRRDVNVDSRGIWEIETKDTGNLKHLVFNEYDVESLSIQKAFKKHKVLKRCESR